MIIAKNCRFAKLDTYLMGNIRRNKVGKSESIISQVAPFHVDASKALRRASIQQPQHQVLTPNPRQI